jgi:hypothetical protein
MIDPAGAIMKKQQNDRAESGSSNSLLWGYSLLTIAVLLLSIDAVLILEVSNLGAWYFSLLSARDIFNICHRAYS